MKIVVCQLSQNENKDVSQTHEFYEHEQPTIEASQKRDTDLEIL